MARCAHSLDVLLGQINTLFPNRDKVSDGWIGDAAHAGRTSDHNPDTDGVVHARDFTHDPVGGLDCDWLASRLVRYADSRIKYIIWNHKIWQRNGWVAYNGTNPHTKHLHLSVVAGTMAESQIPWNLGERPVPDMTPTQAEKLNDVHFAVTQIPQDGKRVPLQTYAANTNEKIDALGRQLNEVLSILKPPMKG